MINVSRELGRLVNRTEIEALLRIPAAPQVLAAAHDDRVGIHQ